MIFHFLLLRGQQLVDFKLAVELLFKIFHNEFNLSNLVAQLIILNFNLCKLSLVLSVIILFLFHLRFEFFVFFFKFYWLFFLIL